MVCLLLLFFMKIMYDFIIFLTIVLILYNYVHLKCVLHFNEIKKKMLNENHSLFFIQYEESNRLGALSSKTTRFDRAGIL